MEYNVGSYKITQAKMKIELILILTERVARWLYIKTELYLQQVELVARKFQSIYCLEKHSSKIQVEKSKKFIQTYSNLN